MSFILQSKENKTPEEGVVQAVCTAIYDLGTQLNTYNNKEQKKVLIEWEIQNEDSVMYVYKSYTASLYSNATLTKDLQSWIGEINQSFDLESLLGKNAQLMIKKVEVNGKTYTKVASIMGLPKGMKPLKPFKEVMVYHMGENFPNGMPEWIKKIVSKSKEYQETLKEVPFN
jgi:hypothetical protein